jgi:hypothetical protein
MLWKVLKNQEIRHGVCQFVFTKEYYLNSVASPIYINPVGEMDFKGLSTEIMFFKDFQEKSGLKWKSFATEVQCCRAFFRK